MLAKKRRLNLSKDFKWIVSGRSVSGQNVKIYLKTDDQIKSQRIGIAVSSRVFKKAHERNRAKRVISAAMESIISDIPESTHIIVLPKLGILSVKSDEVEHELRKLIIKGSEK